MKKIYTKAYILTLAHLATPGKRAHLVFAGRIDEALIRVQAWPDV